MAAAGSGSPLVVNDLDLVVSGPDGTFLGNNFSGNWSTTGGSADHRVRLKPSEIGGFASAVARELGVEGGWDTPLPDGAREKAGLVARDLRAAGSAGLVAVGRRQPPVLHALAHRMNRALGAGAQHA